MTEGKPERMSWGKKVAIALGITAAGVGAAEVLRPQAERAFEQARENADRMRFKDGLAVVISIRPAGSTMSSPESGETRIVTFDINGRTGTLTITQDEVEARELLEGGTVMIRYDESREYSNVIDIDGFSEE